MIAAVIEGTRQRLEREHNERAWLAWHVAALPRAKRFPKLESMMVNPRRRRNGKAQTVDDMKTIARMVTLAYGGRVGAP